MESEKVKDWENILKEWDSFPIDGYKLIFTEAKENFEERASDSESITNKSIKVLTISTTYMVAFVAFISGQNIPICPTCIVSIFIIYSIIIGISVFLMLPKGIRFRGTSPKDCLLDCYDDKEYNESDKERLTYYNTIIQYSWSIDEFDIILKKRQSYYKALLYTTIAFFIVSMLIIIT